jgi:Putative prokaryotic signal transducing protein
MRALYDAENVVDAHLVKHALEAAGISAFIRGEYLTGALGELPMHGVVQVCVPAAAWADAQACLAQLDLARSLADDAADPADPAGDGLLA